MPGCRSLCGRNHAEEALRLEALCRHSSRFCSLSGNSPFGIFPPSEKRSGWRSLFALRFRDTLGATLGALRAGTALESPERHKGDPALITIRPRSGPAVPPALQVRGSRNVRVLMTESIRVLQNKYSSFCAEKLACCSDACGAGILGRPASGSGWADP